MSILLHICCAPCLLGPLDELRRAGFVGYFYNPNTHPLIEFRRRLKAVQVLAEQERFDLVCDEQYGLTKFLETVDWRGPNRCRDCYRLRLRAAANLARERGCEAFTTTLLVSIYQNHEALRQVGQEVAAETGVPFVYHDWRPLADNGRQAAKSRSLYRQQYCGCVFSEFDRYKNASLHLHRPGETP